jgi:hypothetical protein
VPAIYENFFAREEVNRTRASFTDMPAARPVTSIAPAR